jgi:succinate-semialdehyde dehydrogenase/glutarate-semialdehyde dehydrogenase
VVRLAAPNLVLGTHEELFGPVAVVHLVEDDDEAVDLATTRRTASAVINHPALSRPELPFGGIKRIKRSAHGRELADLGTREFANRKLICVVPPDAPIGSFAG